VEGYLETVGFGAGGAAVEDVGVVVWAEAEVVDWGDCVVEEGLVRVGWKAVMEGKNVR